jgi:hypothetical protein
MNIVMIDNLLNVKSKAIMERKSPDVNVNLSKALISLYLKIRNQTVTGMLKLYMEDVAFGCLKKEIAYPYSLLGL